MPLGLWHFALSVEVCNLVYNNNNNNNWARYCHHNENPMQFTEAPVSIRPSTGMPSSVSWPVMGGSTAHPTGVTLASDDPSSS